MPNRSAFVGTILTMVDRRTAIAASTASTDVGVELLQNPCRNLADQPVAERGVDVVPGVRLVPLARGLFKLVHLEPLCDRQH
jgi:hypothetical protein